MYLTVVLAEKAESIVSKFLKCGTSEADTIAIRLCMKIITVIYYT